MLTNTINVINEVQQNFIDSSYDTNCNRAFPDVRDGLKPGQRAIIWEMYTKKYTSNKPHVKSAKIDGGVAALWWPHGTTAIYETFARMSQPFTNNIPEIDFHGANGNIILGGDAIAADRYTEARLAKITEEGMLAGIDQHNVPMQLNFSEDEEWPKVLPAVFPRLLVNGAQGIGVSVANTWLPHNFTETAYIILEYMRTGELNAEAYYPDFPTGGTIVNKDDLAVINKTGKGKVILEAKYKIQGQEIIFYEMPYQVYIEPVIEKIKECVDQEQLTGISGVYNKSDKKNIALVVECNKKENPEKVVEQLFELTPLRSQYNVNQNGIVSKTPILLNLQQVIDIYIEHNTGCIKREHEYRYQKALEKIEILEGLLLAIQNIDKIVQIIRETSSPKEQLQIAFSQLTDRQVKAILEMRLNKLSKLESTALENDLKNYQDEAAYCDNVINSQIKQKNVLDIRLKKLLEKYGDERRTDVIQKEITKIAKSAGKAKVEEAPQDIVVTLDSNGYIKAVPVAQYKKDKNAIVEFKTTTKDLILLFSSLGKCYRISSKDIGLTASKEKGKACGAILNMESGEKILYATSSEINEKRPYITYATDNGLVKKTKKDKLIGTTRNLNGVNCMGLTDNKVCYIIESNGDILTLGTKNGYYISFKLDDINETGKASKGVKGINLGEGDVVVTASLNNVPKNGTVTKRAGKGKKL